MPSVNQETCHQSARWPPVPLSFRIFPFSDLVWMYIKATLFLHALSWLPCMDTHQFYSFLEVTVWPWWSSVRCQINDSQQKLAEEREQFSWNRQAAAQSKTELQQSATDVFFLNLLYHKLTQSALRLLFWVVSRTRKHTSFTRRGSHCRCVHALLTPFMLHMCACLSTRAQLLCMFIYVTESGHNLGRTNNYFII